MTKTYTTKNIVEMGQIEHIRHNSGMYIGSSETPTRLLEELLDNALDEVQAGHCNKIAIMVNTTTGNMCVIDDGRGFPFNQSLTVSKDPPVLSCTKLFTSGKFKKGDSDSAYKIASGLHGIGLVACNALSSNMAMEVCRDKKKGLYTFKNGKFINRSQSDLDTKKPFSTSISVTPDKKYFDSLIPDLAYIEERLMIACCDYPKLTMMLQIDDVKKLIKGDEKKLINDYLSKTCTEWIKLENNKNDESCAVNIGWDVKPPSSSKYFTSVNLARVHDGSHVTKLNNMLKTVFQAYAKKHKHTFSPEDCLNYIRVYINLKIIDTSFEAQIKVRLGKKSDLGIMDNIETKLKQYLDKNPDKLKELLDRFQQYRDSINNKKITKQSGNKKRGFSNFTKLRDCTKPGGELLISEGDSAAGGLIQTRDPSKHAILPLKGVIPNAITKKDILKNVEIKEIIQAMGCGVNKDCDINALRYKKIIICTDADPAGHFISSLLISMFSYLVPDVVKSGSIYICKTPLYGHGYDDKFVPIWSEDELDEFRKLDKPIRRFKGLGEFNPKELHKFTLDSKNRTLIQVNWPSDDNNVKLMFNLASSSVERRDLMFNGLTTYMQKYIGDNH